MRQLNACPLMHRGVLRLEGDDRRTFLQGLISNDIQLCAPGKPLYAALLSPQGKFLHDMFIFDAGHELLIDCEAGRADDLLQRLNAYRLRAKITLTNATEEFNVWAAWGECDSMPDFPDCITGRDPRHADFGLRLLCRKGAQPENVQHVPFDAYDMMRIRLAAPDGSRDMVVGQSTLLESNFDRMNGISWSKGCYIGQELTARMHYRALIKKRLYPVTITGIAPESGSIIYSDGLEIGDMRSHVGDIGLALLKCESAEAEKLAVLKCGEAILAVSLHSFQTQRD